MRWNFPLWGLAADLDPADLKRPPRRIVTPKEPAPPAPAKPSYDVARFAEEFLTPTPRTRAVIVEAAGEKGVSERRALKLLEAGTHQGKAYRWEMSKDRRAYYANRPQPTLTEEVRP